MESADRVSEVAMDADAVLMVKVSEGDDHALRMLIEKWKNPLLNFFYRSVKDVHTSEDLAQKTFINLYRAREGYTVRGKFSTYIFHIARSVLINEFRRAKRKPAEVTDPADMPAVAVEDASSKMAELEEIFQNTLQLLPENQRTSILLLKQQQLSYEEIAEIMRANVSNVKTWIHRARMALKEALMRYEQ